MEKQIENPASIGLFAAPLAAGVGFVIMLTRLHGFSQWYELALTAGLLGAGVALFVWGMGLLFNRGGLGASIVAVIGTGLGVYFYGALNVAFHS